MVQEFQTHSYKVQTVVRNSIGIPPQTVKELCESLIRLSQTATRVSTHVLNKWADERIDKEAIKAAHAKCTGIIANQNQHVANLAKVAGMPPQERLQQATAIVDSYDMSVEALKKENAELKYKMEDLTHQHILRQQENIALSQKIRVSFALPPTNRTAFG